MPDRSNPGDNAAEDGALARRVMGGDNQAEASLCRRLQPRAVAWALRHVRTEADAHDLAQHATIVLLEALRASRVEDPDRIGAFFLGVCKRTLHSWRAGERLRTDLLARFGPALAAPSEIRDGAIDRVKLRSCLERLEHRPRVVLALSFWAECSADEIALELGTSAGNVRVLRHRALGQLVACMDGAS